MNIDRTRYKNLKDYNKYISSTSSATVTQLTNAILFLNNTLHEEELALTTYDVMKITQTVSGSNEFGQAKASLGFNDALIVNSLTEFSIGSESFKRGDIVYKDNNGEYHTIKSQTAGYFKPESYDATKHILSFTYEVSNPSGIRAENFEIYKDPGVYNIREDFSAGMAIKEYLFNNCKTEVNFSGGKKELSIFPTVEFCYKDDNQLEHLVEIDYTLALNSSETKWTLSSDTALPFPFVLVIK